jgi:shikimate kinase
LSTLLVLAGPKGAGKSWVAHIAERDFDVRYIDADLLILELRERGSSPDPRDGWLEPVRSAVLDALARHRAVSVEITGGWDSDYELMRAVADGGHRVVRIWISAPLDETLARLRDRTTRKVPVTEAEARSTYQRAVTRAAREQWDATIDTSGDKPTDIAAFVLRDLLADDA